MRVPGAVYVKTLYRISGQDYYYCRHHIIRAAVAAGTGSNPDVDVVLTYAWTQTAGTPTVTLSDAAVASPTFNAPTGSTVSSTFTFTLRVTDDDGSFDEDSVDVTVNAPNTVSVETDASALADGDVPDLTLTSNIATRIAVTWTASTKPSGQTPASYRINWGKASENYPSYTDENANTCPASNALSHTLTGLEGDVEYKVRIRTRYGTAWSGPWKEARITVPGPPPPTVTRTDNSVTIETLPEYLVDLEVPTLTLTSPKSSGPTIWAHLTPWRPMTASYWNGPGSVGMTASTGIRSGGRRPMLRPTRCWRHSRRKIRRPRSSRFPSLPARWGRASTTSTIRCPRKPVTTTRCRPALRSRATTRTTR